MPVLTYGGICSFNFHYVAYEKQVHRNCLTKVLVRSLICKITSQLWKKNDMPWSFFFAKITKTYILAFIWWINSYNICIWWIDSGNNCILMVKGGTMETTSWETFSHLLRLNFISWSVSHVPRLCNRVAHELAAMGSVCDPTEAPVLAPIPAQMMYLVVDDSALS